MSSLSKKNITFFIPSVGQLESLLPCSTFYPKMLEMIKVKLFSKYKPMVKSNVFIYVQRIPRFSFSWKSNGHLLAEQRELVHLFFSLIPLDHWLLMQRGWPIHTAQGVSRGPQQSGLLRHVGQGKALSWDRTCSPKGDFLIGEVLLCCLLSHLWF